MMSAPSPTHSGSGVRSRSAIPGAGHFAWLDEPDHYFESIARFVIR